MVRLAVAAFAVLVLVAAGFVSYRTLTFATPAPQASVAVPDVHAFPVDDAVAAHHLSTAVGFNTVSLAPQADAQAGAAPQAQQDAIGGRDSFVQFQAWLQQTYPAFHAAAKRENIADLSLLYTWAGSDPAQPPLLLLAHQDTVPVPPDTLAAWRHDPFGGEIVDGAVWGRGALDDKGSLIAILEAAEALARAGMQPKRTILIAFGHDEEVAGDGAAAIAAHLQAQGVRAWFVLDEGMVSIARHPLTGAPTSLIGISEKGFGTLRVTARGLPGHSSTPPPETAISTLAEAVTRIHTMPIDRGVEGGGPALDMMRALAPQLSLPNRAALANEWLFGPMLRVQLANNAPAQALLGTTVAPTVISGGSRANVLPGEATALINMRIHPRDTPADLLARARRAVAGLHDVAVIWDGPPREASPVSRTNSASYALIAALARATYPNAPVAPTLVLGGTDSRSYTDVAENVYRYQAVMLTNEDLETIHGVNEHVSIENLDRMIRFYMGLMRAGAM